MPMILLFIFFSFTASAQVRPYQTARLKATGGAGVGSMLVIESSILNPAPLAFFGDSFASYQKTSTKFNDKNVERSADNRQLSKANRSEGYFLFDNTSGIKGGFSFVDLRENGFGRERATVTGATMLSESVSAGITVQHNEDTRPSWYSNNRHKTSNSFVLGLSWVAMESLSFGAVMEDVGKTFKDESRFTLGAQYTLTPDLVVMVDAGGDPRGDFAKRHLWRVAAQYRLFDDFFARIGQYKDNTINEKGLGWGVSWTGPKLGVDFAMKRAKQLDSGKGYLYPNETISDISFAVNLRF